MPLEGAVGSRGGLSAVERRRAPRYRCRCRVLMESRATDLKHRPPETGDTKSRINCWVAGREKGMPLRCLDLGFVLLYSLFCVG